MSDYFIIRLSITVMIIVATVIFAGVCLKRRDLISWLFAYITSSISETFRLISQEDYDLFLLISLFFSMITIIIIIIAVAREYYKTFYKTSKFQILLILLITVEQVISIGLQLIIGILLILALFLILKIYLMKKTPTHAFLCLILLCGILNFIAIMLRDAGFEGAEEFFLFSSAVMTTNMFLTGIVALIEERLVKSEKKYRLSYNRAEFYKDLFVHDINNILQNLQFSLEIISQTLVGYENREKIDDLINIAKGQVNRGANLGLSVKKLSDLEAGTIQNEPVELKKVLEESINYINTKFPGEQIGIKIENSEEKILVYANKLLVDVFNIVLNNAVKYNNNPTKEVLIKILREKKDLNYNIKIEFIDNGMGIPDSMKKNIFQPIYKKTPDFKRIGLGLLLVNAVIESFFGKVWAEDKILGDYTKGSRIVFLIPEAYEILDIKR